MGRLKRAFGLEEKEEVVVLADEKEDIEVLIEPVGTEKMTGHAEQHSALTRIERDNVVKFAATGEDITELENEVNRNTGDIDDISEYLGGIYFEVSLGKDKYVFDTQQTPNNGNFTAFSYGFEKDNDKFWINAFLGDGTASVVLEKARPGDKLNIVYPSSPASNFGQYFIISKRLDGDIWIIDADFIQGSGRLQAGFSYDIEVIHITKQFNDDGVGGENHSGEISDLTERVNDNSDSILELRKNDEYFAEGSRDNTTTYKKNSFNPQQKWATTSNSESESYLTFGGNENYWEHEWKTDTPAKMIFNFKGNRVLEINSNGVLINGSPSIQANTIFESIKDSSNFDEFKEALLTRISTEGIDKDE